MEARQKQHLPARLFIDLGVGVRFMIFFYSFSDDDDVRAIKKIAHHTTYRRDRERERGGAREFKMLQ